MIFLKDGQSIKAVTTSAVTTRELDALGTYVDMPDENRGSSSAQIDNTAAAIVSGVSRHVRQIEDLFINNQDTVDAEVTVMFVDEDGNETVLNVTTLAAGQTLIYHDGDWDTAWKATISTDFSAEHGTSGQHGGAKKIAAQVVADETARLAIADPREGMIVFQSDTDQFWAYDGTAWELIGGGAQGVFYGTWTEVKTITGAVTDGYAGALRLDPGYTAATAQTVTRHNYIDAQNVSVAGAGPAAVTAAALVRFDAAAGTHKAVDAATTKTTPGGVDAWIKVNVNGTIMYVPVYASKTA